MLWFCNQELMFFFVGGGGVMGLNGGGDIFYLRLGLFYLRLVFVTYGGLFCLRLKFGVVFCTYS